MELHVEKELEIQNLYNGLAEIWTTSFMCHTYLTSHIGPAKMCIIKTQNLLIIMWCLSPDEGEKVGQFLCVNGFFCYWPKGKHTSRHGQSYFLCSLPCSYTTKAVNVAPKKIGHWYVRRQFLRVPRFLSTVRLSTGRLKERMKEDQKLRTVGFVVIHKFTY